MGDLPASVAFQLRIWDCAYTGRINEPAALTAENPPGRERWVTDRLFDRTDDDLTGSFVDQGAGWEPCPRWWALPWVAEQIATEGASQ